jgi:CRP-like cAMP-binding protein
MFSNLPTAALEAVLSSSRVRRHPRHTVLFEQGDPASEFYVVLEGWTKLFRITPGGDEAVVGTFTRGDCFGEAPCLSGGHYPVGAQTVTEARLLAIPADRIVAQIRLQPEIGLAMLASTSLHLRKLVDQIEELKARTGPQRLAEFLVGLAGPAEGFCTITLPYEKMLIAGRLGMKPESLSRAFQKLRGVGVSIDHDKVAIESVSRLADFAGRERMLATSCPGLRAGYCRPIALARSA